MRDHVVLTAGQATRTEGRRGAFRVRPRPAVVRDVLESDDPYDFAGNSRVYPTAVKTIPERLRQIHGVHGPRAAREFLLEQVMELSFMGLSKARMAEILGRSERQVERYLADVRKAAVEQVETLAGQDLIGRCIAHYERHIAMGWRRFQYAGDDGRERDRGARMALAAQDSFNHFLERWGFFDHHRYRPPAIEHESGAGTTRAGQLLEAVEEILGATEAVLDETAYDDISP